MDILYELLTAPDSFDGDWYGWATNQAGHMVLGAALAALLMLLRHAVLNIWDVLLFHPWGSAPIAVLLYVPAELIQWFFGGELLDAAADTLFVFVGAVLAWASWVNREKALKIAAILAAAVAAIGIGRRLK